jgi:hypothetical protein
MRTSTGKRFGKVLNLLKWIYQRFVLSVLRTAQGFDQISLCSPDCKNNRSVPGIAIDPQQFVHQLPYCIPDLD